MRLRVAVAPDVGRVGDAVREACVNEPAVVVEAGGVRRAPAVADLECVVAAHAVGQEVAAGDVEAVGRAQERRRLERATPNARAGLETRLDVAQFVLIEVEHEVVADVRPHYVEQPAITDDVLVAGLPEGRGAGQPAELAEVARHSFLAVGGLDRPRI